MTGGAEPVRRTPPKFPRPTPVPRVRSPRIDALAPADVDTFWAEVDRLPLVEENDDGTMMVTFCWRDPDAVAVLLFANRLTDETHLADTLLERVPGTDLWHASYLMSTRWRASYAFLVQRTGEAAPWILADQVSIRATLDRGRPDPRNPVTCRNRAGIVQSVAEGPDAPRQPWLAQRPEVPKGTVVATAGPQDREVWTYDPPGVAPDAALPLLMVLDGEVWVDTHSLPTTLDNLVADGEVGPVRAVLLASGGRDARWRQMSGEGGEDAYVADHLVPWMRARGGVLPGAEAVTVVGQSLGGLTALRLGLTRADVVGGVVSHSASLWQDPLLTRSPAGPVRVHLAHGAQEWVLTGDHDALAQRLRLVPEVTLDVAVHDGGHDYAWWRGGVADGIRWVLATQPPVGGVQH